MILAISEGLRPWGNQGRNRVSFALSQLLITHSDTSSSLARRSVPLSAVGYLSLSIHNCRTYYLNPRTSIRIKEPLIKS